MKEDRVISPERPQSDPKLAIYLASVVGFFIATAISMAAYGYWLAPAVGDLARIGGYSERDYGVQHNPIGYAKDKFETLNMSDVIARRNADGILVLGDSFTMTLGGGISWMNDLHWRTGQPVRTAQYADIRDVERYLTSDTFKKAPPQALVIELVERQALVRGELITSTIPEGQRVSCRLTTVPRPLPAEPLPPPQMAPLKRIQPFSSIEDLFSRAALAIKIDLGLAGRSVYRFDLTNKALFSTAKPDKILIYAEDIDIFKDVNPINAAQHAEAARCGLAHLVALAGNVPTWLVIAPDKSMIYRPWIAQPPRARDVDMIEEARRALGPHFIDLRGPIGQAVRSGVKDVYWPDDTHWGVAGHRLAGQVIAQAMTQAPESAAKH